MNRLMLLIFLVSIPTAAQVLKLGGHSTGAGVLSPDISVQVAQQGVKLDSMDININRRLDDLAHKMDDMEKTTDSLRTDMARLSVFSSIFGFGVSSMFTILLSVGIGLPLTFIVQRFLRVKFPEPK